jgi:hypothetical protein
MRLAVTLPGLANHRLGGRFRLAWAKLLVQVSYFIRLLRHARSSISATRSQIADPLPSLKPFRELYALGEQHMDSPILDAIHQRPAMSLGVTICFYNPIATASIRSTPCTLTIPARITCRKSSGNILSFVSISLSMSFHTFSKCSASAFGLNSP